jgi:hypothetical protein
MTLGRFSNPSASDISSGLVPVPPPIKQSDVTAVRTNYGIDAGFKPKGQSDSSLYSHSVDFVLAWWKRNNPAAGGGGGTGDSGGSGGTGGTGGGSGSGGSGGMTDTAVGSGGPSAADQAALGHILTPQEQQAQQLANQRGAVTAGKADPTGTPPANLAPPAAAPFGSGRAQDTALPSVPNKPIVNPSAGIAGVVSKATAQSILTQMGVRGVTPPASVLTSPTALRAWATQQLAKQKLAAARGALTAKKAGV